MASTDFSLHAYTYDDVPYDYELAHFSLRDEDTKLKASGGSGAGWGVGARGLGSGSAPLSRRSPSCTEPQP